MSVTIAVWALFCVVVEFIAISAFLHSSDPSDVYDKTWGFQLIVFAIFRFPIWLLGLLLILGAERLCIQFIARRYRKNSDLQAQ